MSKSSHFLLPFEPSSFLPFCNILLLQRLSRQQRKQFGSRINNNNKQVKHQQPKSWALFINAICSNFVFLVREELFFFLLSVPNIIVPKRKKNCDRTRFGRNSRIELRKIFRHVSKENVWLIFSFTVWFPFYGSSFVLVPLQYVEIYTLHSWSNTNWWNSENYAFMIILSCALKKIIN